MFLRYSAVPRGTALCILVSFNVACSGSNEHTAASGGKGDGGAGATQAGTPNLGGNTAAGGAAATGGTGTGGVNATGGNANSGGATTGGNSTNSGGLATGGTAGAAIGGGPAMGGTNAAGANSGGKSGSGGAGSGAGGLPSVPDNGCNVRLSDAPIGFAAQDGGTIGGGKATPILVTTAAGLKAYLADNQPRVLYVVNDLDFRTSNRSGVQTCADNTKCDNGSGVMVDQPRVSTNCDSTEHASTSYRYETSLKVGSNKTVIGIGSGSGAALRGASLDIGASQQVIIRNLKIYDINPHLVEAGDGITLQGSSHIWLDHLLLQQISDGYVDIGSADHSTTDDYVTLSWIHFDGHTAYQCGGKHSFVNFVDNGRISYHHDFYDNANGRNPKISGASSQVHLFNNYWLNIGYFCVTAQVDAKARVESNYFENSARPHWLQLDGNGTAGIAIDTGNVYTGASNGNTNRDTGGSVFNAPYAYTKQSAAEAKDAITKCAGPQPIR